MQLTQIQKRSGEVSMTLYRRQNCRGEGLMLGLKCKVDNMELIETGYDQKLLLIPAADNVIRILPPLNITDQEIREGINRIETIAASFQEKIK